MNWKEEAIAELKEYTQRCAATKDILIQRLAAITERGLNSVGEQFAAILKETYINNTPTKALCSKYNLNKYQLNIWRDEALTYFTIALYGVCEI